MSELVGADRVYQDLCAGIRATDDISFKLIGLVPLLSGAGILTLFINQTTVHEKVGLVAFLGLYAAAVSLGLFRWELRNIQTCGWLAARAAALDQAIAVDSRAPPKPERPQKIGKTEAEKFIYSITILSWLVMPVVAVPAVKATPWFCFYVVVSAVIVVATLISALAEVGVPNAKLLIPSDA